MRRCLTTAAVAVAMSLSFTAMAQEKPNCPPGSWFCEDVDVQAPPAQNPSQKAPDQPVQNNPPPAQAPTQQPSQQPTQAPDDRRPQIIIQNNNTNNNSNNNNNQNTN